MKASVTIPSNELKRLFLKAINGKDFSQRVISEITYRLIDRIERDYPDMLKGIYQTAHRKYQNELALRLKRQREHNLRNIYGDK
ncbi:hypothetical protein vB_AbaM_Acibel004_8 [Acinetobacter phage vB_AbaM_Acibel004]|uniref:hypothetical protein n=1 Tax=Acinetobacter phage vB_AbaM_Acibel004 TaxID=1481186 RepID=UPI0004E85872|nr:hypothetical protein vB_AbaM_Acibel004_8 [Acinetobacter phage vB_AbaM_Acibel004]AHY26623.1 hypothetical protein vB_AbaM_Acibel004_8 [Acinetobacter phage vB_AbaM_Acibel004]